jgi:tetratricopeptide (TPR) repeat protein
VVLEGSVRRSAVKVRVTTQLTDVAEGFQLFSSRFESETVDIFQLQDDLAGAVFRALRPHLESGSQTHVESFARPQSRVHMPSEAYETYLKGRYHWEQRTLADIQLAGRYFEQALQLDPGSAAVHAGLSDFYALQGTFGLMAPEEAWQWARRYALQAVALDPELAEGHISVANVLQFCDWNWAEARAHIVKALELRPQRGESYYSYAANLMAQGRLTEALEQARRGLHYDPLSAALLAAEAILHVYLGEHASGRLLAQSALSAAPQNSELYYSLAMGQSLAGQVDASIATLELGLQSSGMPLFLGWLAEAYARSGNEQRAREILASLLEMAANGSAIPVAIAVAAASLEEHELAMEWLERAAAVRDIFVVYSAVLPGLRGLHAQPRYHSLLRRMNLPHPSMHTSAMHTSAMPESAAGRGAMYGSTV